MRKRTLFQIFAKQEKEEEVEEEEVKEAGVCQDIAAPILAEIAENYKGREEEMIAKVKKYAYLGVNFLEKPILLLTYTELLGYVQNPSTLDIASLRAKCLFNHNQYTEEQLESVLYACLTQLAYINNTQVYMLDVRQITREDIKSCVERVHVAYVAQEGALCVQGLKKEEQEEKEEKEDQEEESLRLKKEEERLRTMGLPLRKLVERKLLARLNLPIDPIAVEWLGGENLIGLDFFMYRERATYEEVQLPVNFTALCIQSYEHKPCKTILTEVISKGKHRKQETRPHKGAVSIIKYTEKKVGGCEYLEEYEKDEYIITFVLEEGKEVAKVLRQEGYVLKQKTGVTKDKELWVKNGFLGRHLVLITNLATE